MSELICNKQDFCRRHRLLLTTVSFATLVAATASTRAAEDVGRPTVWIELGGQLERVSDGQESFSPPFLMTTPRPDFETIAPQFTQKSPRYSYGGNFGLTVQPNGSPWVVSAGIRYGRSNGKKNFIEQTSVTKTPYPPAPQYLLTKRAHKFARSDSEHRSANVIADFQVGRDVGLGMLGNSGDANISLGIRYAQFGATSTFDVHERPDYGWKQGRRFYTRFYHNFGANEDTKQNAHGVGPSLSLRARSILATASEDTDVTFDWGANAALLFGRQRTSVHHNTSGGYFQSSVGYAPTYRHQYSHSRSRVVTIPNVGGFAGLSVRYADAKLSLGYRADFFLGAVDGGVDSRKSYDRNFFGPFASISIGFGG